MISETQDEEKVPMTVKFNVGGKVYEVSKSLLDIFPNTVLSKMASSWSSASSPIFIDRDPERFASCLDYMRGDGTVHLLETVSKSAFLKDLEFLGFVGVDETKIDDGKSTSQCVERCLQVTNSCKSRIARLEKEANDLDTKAKALNKELRAVRSDCCRRQEEIKLERVILKCFAASVASTEDCFQVNYKDFGARNVHLDQYFIESCEKLGVLVDVGGSTSWYDVTLRRKTNPDESRQE